MSNAITNQKENTVEIQMKMKDEKTDGLITKKQLEDIPEVSDYRLEISKD